MIDTSSFDYQLQSIFDRYDPENDIAPGPDVTWADHHIAHSLVFVSNMLDDLQDQIKELAKDPPTPEMGEYEKLISRLRECEEALISMVKQYNWTFQAGQYLCWKDASEKAFDYLVKHDFASFGGEGKHTITFNEEER